MSKIFVDTNVLAYTIDKKDKTKHKKCREKLLWLEEHGEGVISTQVMQEFFVVVTKKFGVDPLRAKEMLRFFENFEVVLVEPETIKEAVDYHVIHQISFWDALIVASAKSAHCERIWTEDLNPDQRISGILIERPF